MLLKFVTKLYICSFKLFCIEAILIVLFCNIISLIKCSDLLVSNYIVITTCLCTLKSGNTGTSALPDMYLRMYIRVEHECLCYNYYM